MAATSTGNHRDSEAPKSPAGQIAFDEPIFDGASGEQCGVCGRGESEAVLLTLHECTHRVHLACQRTARFPGPCPVCGGQPWRYYRTPFDILSGLVVWAVNSRTQLAFSAAGMLLLAPMYTMSGAYVTQVDHGQEQSRALRALGRSWQLLVAEPDAATWGYVGAHFVHKSTFFVLGAIFTWNLKTFLLFWGAD